MRANRIPLTLAGFLICTVPMLAQDTPIGPAGTQVATEETPGVAANTDALRKAGQNPVASLITVPVQNNNNFGSPAVTTAQEARPPHWSYEGKEGPKEWGKLDSSYAACSIGHTQSPIDIKDARRADLPPLKFDYHAVALNIIDNGHTVQVNYAPGSTLTVGEKIYTLKQFHFHHPSEEQVKGKGFRLVAHLVHADADGHLAVVAVLFELGTANPLIETLWKNIPSEKEKPQDIPSVSVQVQDLLPNERGYFTYAGSLTTPPCSEGVSWYVLKSYATVSPQQVAAFAEIYPMNARPIQPTNGREILQSK